MLFFIVSRQYQKSFLSVIKHSSQVTWAVLLLALLLLSSLLPWHGSLSSSEWGFLLKAGLPSPWSQKGRTTVSPDDTSFHLESTQGDGCALLWSMFPKRGEAAADDRTACWCPVWVLAAGRLSWTAGLCFPSGARVCGLKFCFCFYILHNCSTPWCLLSDSLYLWKVLVLKLS